MKSRIIHFFILSCSRIPFLLEKKMAGKLSLIERIRLKYHLKACKTCSAYEKKADFLDELMSEMPINWIESRFQESEIQGFKNRVKEKLKK